MFSQKQWPLPPATSPYPSIDPFNIGFLILAMATGKTKAVETTLNTMRSDELADFINLLASLLMLAHKTAQELIDNNAH